jgi:cytochrome c553
MSPQNCRQPQSFNLIGLNSGAPPLARHFATYLFRQLLAFRNGDRADPLAALMRPVVARMTEDDMVDEAAYAASLAR